MADNIAILKKLHPHPPVLLSRPQPSIQVIPPQSATRHRVLPSLQQCQDCVPQTPRKYLPILLNSDDATQKNSRLSAEISSTTSESSVDSEEPLINIKKNIAYRKTSSVTPDSEKECEGEFGSADTVQYDYPRVSCAMSNNFDYEDSDSVHYMN